MSVDDFTMPEPESDGDRKLLDEVRGGGWQVVLIPGDEQTPGWAFTIGLYANFDHPEIVVFGLPRQVAHPVLNVIGERVKKGQPFEPEKPYDAILEGLDCTFRTVCERWFEPFLGYANWFHRGTDYPVLQCFWPDKDAHFPWEPDFNEELLLAQPQLFQQDVVGARVEALLDSLEREEEETDPLRGVADKAFAIPGEQIRPMAQGYGACFSTDMIMVEGRKVGYMYREDPDNDVDSGWRFMSGAEPDEYMDDVGNIGLYDVNTVANYDPEIIPLLDAPIGSAFEREEGGGELVEVEFISEE